MTSLILKNEFLKSFSDPKFHISFITCLVLVLAAMVSGLFLYENEMRWYTKANSENLKSVQFANRVSELRSEGVRTIRTPSKMNIFVRGVDNVIGKSATISASIEKKVRDSRYSLNPVLAAFGDLDLVTIAQSVLALFAILFSYNIISGEREQGTLALVMSSSVSRASYIIGKTVGGLISLFFVFLVPFLLGLLYLLFSGMTFSPQEWSRILLIALVICLYITVFFLIGTFMSSLTRSSNVSFLFSLFLWVLLIFVVPKASIATAEFLNPAPSIDEVEAKIASINRQDNQILSKLLPQLYKEKLNKEQSNKDEAGTYAYMQGTENIQLVKNGRIEPILQEYERQCAKLQNSAENISRISPVANMSFAIGRLTNTDASLRARFYKALKTYRYQFLAFLDEFDKNNPDYKRNFTSLRFKGPNGPTLTVDESDDEINMKGFPQFKISQESVASTLETVFIDILILCIQIIVLFLLSFVMFLRYDVR